MFWIVEKIGGYKTDLETVIATFMFILSIFAMIGMATIVYLVWKLIT